LRRPLRAQAQCQRRRKVAAGAVSGDGETLAVIVLWLASGAVTFVALLAAAGLLPEGTAPPVRSTREDRGAIDRGLRRLMIAYGLFGFGYVITATFLVAIVRATPTIRPFEPVIWIVFGIAAVPSVTLWARLAQPIGIPAAFAIACIVEAAGVLASVAWPTTLGVFSAAILVGGTFMGLTALGLWVPALAP